MDINKDIFEKEFYIIDCSNFVFYPRIVKITGLYVSSSEMEFCINVKENYSNEDRRMRKEALLRFKTFEEADEYCRKLNNKTENKKRAEEWNNPQMIYNMMVARNFLNDNE